MRQGVRKHPGRIRTRFRTPHGPSTARGSICFGSGRGEAAARPDQVAEDWPPAEIDLLRSMDCNAR